MDHRQFSTGGWHLYFQVSTVNGTRLLFLLQKCSFLMRGVMQVTVITWPENPRELFWTTVLVLVGRIKPDLLSSGIEALEL